MRILVRALVALVVIVLLVVITFCAAPAGVAAWFVDRQTGGAIVLADAGGLLRAGHARVTDAGGNWSVPVAWTLDAAPLWHGVVAIRFGATPDDAVRGVLRLSRGASEARDVDVTVPAAIADRWLPSIIALRAGGDVTLATPAFRLGDQPQGQATLRWSPARLAAAGAEVIDFGALTAQVDARNDQVVARLASAGGDTEVSGDIRMAGTRLDAEITLAPRTSTPSPLLRLIAPFGATVSGGGTRFSYHGAWQRTPR